MSAADALVLRRALGRALAAERAARGLEALALGLAAAGLACLGALLDAGWSAPRELLAAAALAGAAATATWMLEHARSRADAARALDRRLAEDGLVLSALEARERAPRAGSGDAARAADRAGSLAAALVARAEARLRACSAWRAARAPRLACALPALCVGALLAAALEHEPARVAAPGALARRLEALGASAVVVREAARLEGELRALERGAPRAADAPRAGALARALDELARTGSERTSPPPPPARALLAELAARAEEQAAALGAPSALAPGREAAASPSGAGGAALAAGGSAGAGGQTGPAPVGTMIRSPVQGDRAASASAPERGLVLRRWPAADDALVRRWLAARETLPRR